jgi:hypothetical protein
MLLTEELRAGVVGTRLIKPGDDETLLNQVPNTQEIMGKVKDWGLSPWVRQAVKTLLTVRCFSIVLRSPSTARCAPAGEAEAGDAGAQLAKE